MPIRVHWWVFIDEPVFPLSDAHRRGGGGPTYLKQNLFHPRMIRPVAGGGRPARRQTGVLPKGTGRLSEKSPAGYPPPHHRDDTPGSAGVPPACCPFGCRSVSLRCCSRPPCRSRGRAPLPVDSGGGDGRSCGRICAGGTPALPGGLPPMTWSHQRDKSAEAFCRQLSLKEVHQSSCLFVFIGGSSSKTICSFFLE